MGLAAGGDGEAGAAVGEVPALANVAMRGAVYFNELVGDLLVCIVCVIDFGGGLGGAWVAQGGLC